MAAQDFIRDRAGAFGYRGQGPLLREKYRASGNL